MLTRRRFLKTAALAGAAAVLPVSSRAATGVRALSLRNLHTGERLDLEYFREGSYDPEAVAEIDHFFRCHFTGESTAMDLRTVDLLAGIQQATDPHRRVEIISGYRSPRYNELLARQGRGVAPNSLHLRGLAIDFTVPGSDTGDLFRLARSFRLGGVGRYPDFVHIDAGRVRYW